MDALVRAMPVVVMDPGVESVRALAGVLIGEAVSPFAQGGLDEALGLTVGLGPVGSGELVLQAQLLASLGKVLGAEGRPVVGEQAANAHAQNS